MSNDLESEMKYWVTGNYFYLICTKNEIAEVIYYSYWDI